jgi:hypothetical protein
MATRIETPNGCKIDVPGLAYLDGRDLTGQWLGLLSQPNKPFAIHRLRHGARVNVLEMQREGDTVWFYVRNGRRQGWVSWMFVNEVVK